MWTVLLSLVLLQVGTPAPAQPEVPAVRTEKMTPSEVQQLTDAKASVAAAQIQMEQAKAAGSKKAAKAAQDAAQARLNQANRELQGAQDGISLAHHANTECGCYVQSQGRDYDRVEFKDDSIIIRHVHEGPPALH